MRIDPSSSRKTRVSASGLTLIVALVAIVIPAGAQADFGLHGLDVTFTGADGSVESQAGSHPFAFTTTFSVNTAVVGGNEIPEGELRDVNVMLPAGIVGDPTAVPRCSETSFLKFRIVNGEDKGSSCPDASAVGVIKLGYGFKEPLVETTPVYSLVPAPGVAAKLGFFVTGEFPVTVDIGLNPDPPHNLIAKATSITQGAFLYGSELTVWGDPASPAHDAQRGDCLIEGGTCPVNIPEVSFLRLPTSCTGPLSTVFQADSWQHPGAWFEESILTHDGSDPPSPLGMTGCAKLGFSPTITAQPTSQAAQSPTGLDFGLNVADEGLTSPAGLAQSDIKKTVVTLPEGMTANPSLAEGLNVCTEEDLAHETVSSLPGEGCPNESKIGTVEVESPLIEEPLKGSLFIAKPYANPFELVVGDLFRDQEPDTGNHHQATREGRTRSPDGTVGDDRRKHSPAPVQSFHVAFPRGIPQSPRDTARVRNVQHEGGVDPVVWWGTRHHDLRVPYHLRYERGSVSCGWDPTVCSPSTRGDVEQQCGQLLPVRSTHHA